MRRASFILHFSDMTRAGKPAVRLASAQRVRVASCLQHGDGHVGRHSAVGGRASATPLRCPLGSTETAPRRRLHRTSRRYADASTACCLIAFFQAEQIRLESTGPRQRSARHLACCGVFQGHTWCKRGMMPDAMRHLVFVCEPSWRLYAQSQSASFCFFFLAPFSQTNGQHVAHVSPNARQCHGTNGTLQMCGPTTSVVA
jgi:hypothetical protein